jgi:hypothetical protein
MPMVFSSKSKVGSKSRVLSTGLGLSALVGMLAGGVAMAHHSFTATYFEDRKVTIEGRVLQFQFRNPHSFLHVQAPDENGEMHRWAVEWGGSGQLSNQGLTNATFRPGDHVIVTGSPGRDPEDHRMVMVYLERPSDGLTWGDDPDERFD